MTEQICLCTELPVYYSRRLPISLLGQCQAAITIAVIASYVSEPTRRLFGQFGSEAFRTGQSIMSYYSGQSVRRLRSTRIVTTSEYLYCDASLSTHLEYERKQETEDTIMLALLFICKSRGKCPGAFTLFALHSSKCSGKSVKSFIWKC